MSPPPERFINTTSLTLTMMLVARSDAIAPLSVEAAKFACEGVAPGALAILPTRFDDRRAALQPDHFAQPPALAGRADGL